MNGRTARVQLASWTWRTAAWLFALLVVQTAPARAQTPATRAHERIVHARVVRSVSNGCEYHAKLDGVLRDARAGVVPSLTVRAEVACPSGERVQQHATIASSRPWSVGRLSSRASRAAEVTERNGVDRCVYEPDLRFDGVHVESGPVRLACTTHIDPRDSD